MNPVTVPIFDNLKHKVCCKFFNACLSKDSKAEYISFCEQCNIETWAD